MPYSPFSHQHENNSLMPHFSYQGYKWFWKIVSNSISDVAKCSRISTNSVIQNLFPIIKHFITHSSLIPAWKALTQNVYIEQETSNFNDKGILTLSLTQYYIFYNRSMQQACSQCPMILIDETHQGSIPYPIFSKTYMYLDTETHLKSSCKVFTQFKNLLVIYRGVFI